MKIGKTGSTITAKVANVRARSFGQVRKSNTTRKKGDTVDLWVTHQAPSVKSLKSQAQKNSAQGKLEKITSKADGSRKKASEHGCHHAVGGKETKKRVTN